MLELKNVVFSHPDSATTYRYNLDVARSEIVAVMGASGSGKSTLLDLIAGFLRPVEGKIYWDGESFDMLPPEKRPVSLLFQSENLFDHLSVMQNVLLGLPRRKQKSAASRAQVLTLLDEMGLTGFEAKRASTLSGGQQQRVALARSLISDRPVLLLDEPFSALDEGLREQMYDLVRAAARDKNRAVIVVTHDGRDVEKLGARRCDLSSGELR